MSQQRPKSAKSANPLQKPWTRTDKSKTHTAKTAQVKPATSKPARAVLDDENKVYGENACRVAFLQRPEALVRLYLSEQMAPKFADLMKYLAANKKAYHVVSEAELEKVAGSQHHGGVVLLVKRKPVVSLATYLTQNGRKKQDCLLALDGVGNPHNLGAIARSCAHFGISGIVMKDPDLLAHGAAARTAEGGVEFVRGIREAFPCQITWRRRCHHYRYKEGGYYLERAMRGDGRPLQPIEEGKLP